MKKKTSKCNICGKKAVIIYSDEPVFALTHGFGGTPLCRICYIHECLRKVKDVMSNLEKEVELLRKYGGLK